MSVYNKLDTTDEFESKIRSVPHGANSWLIEGIPITIGTWQLLLQGIIRYRVDNELRILHPRLAVFTLYRPGMGYQRIASWTPTLGLRDYIGEEPLDNLLGHDRSKVVQAALGLINESMEHL